jgi:hypothetical protein
VGGGFSGKKKGERKKHATAEPIVPAKIFR